MIKDLLPVGSVIKLKGEDKRLMIFGILQKLSDDDTIYDYVGVPYPEGFIGTDFQFVFNSSDIEEVVFTGFESEEDMRPEQQGDHRRPPDDAVDGG